MEVTAAMVKELRERTGAGMLDCKKMLVEANGDMDKAIDLLREKGLAAAAKKAGRIAAEGLVESYIHMGGKIGVLVEFELGNAATAQNDEFKALAHDVAMQVAATKPLCAVREDMNPEVVEHELTIYREQAAASGKPEAIQEKMAQGRVEKFYKENTLVDQEFVKNPDVTISQYVASVAKAVGDTIAVKGFDIFVLGE